MSNREIVKTEDVSVRIMDLEKDGSTDWHFHTEVSDFFVCLNGPVQVETRNPDGRTILRPGEYTEIRPMQVHRVLNIGEDRAEYLLVQGVGSYDFCRAKGE